MVNNDGFVKRLENVMVYYHLNASAFADKLAIQRSSISHILSGRNKPSLDFILKIITEFPEIDFYWLLLGEGSFPKSSTVEPEIKKQITLDFKPKEDALPETTKPLPSFSTNNEIEKIIFFYKDGSFQEYKPK